MSIEVRNITKYYGRHQALDNVTFAIETGEVAAFLGPNGAGKSTLMKIITGYLSPTSGEVFVDGVSIHDNPVGIKRKIGYLPENNPLYHDMFVKEYLQFIAGIYRTGKELIDEIIELTGLQPEYKKLIGSLSKGYKQRVGLAQALLHNPAVLILDEPTSGLDPNQIIEIRELIKTVGKQKTVLLSTHIMQEVEVICNRVIIINYGKIVADGLPEKMRHYSFDGHRTVYVEFNNAIGEDKIYGIKGVKTVKKVKDNTFLITCSGEDDIRPGIFNLAVMQNIQVLEMQMQEKSMEEVFQGLTVNKARDVL